MSFVQRSPFLLVFILSLFYGSQAAFQRVLGGGPAENFVVRRMANILITLKNDKYGSIRQETCSGSVLDRKWLLTAAHCFFKEGIADSTLMVVVNESFASVGEANATLELSGTDIQSYTFESVFIHKDFVPLSNNIASDIAVVKLKRRIPRSRFASVSISGSSNKRKLRQRKVSAAGYGTIDNIGTLPDELMETELMTETFRTCEKRIDDNFRRFLEDDKMICAVSLGFPDNGTTDTCRGDSGGPLFIGNDEKDSFFQIGITSVGPRVCADPGSVAWYTRVSYYHDEIQEVLKGDSDAWNVFE